MPVNRGRIPTVNRAEKVFSADADQYDQKIIRMALPGLSKRTLVHSQISKGENAMDLIERAKAAMLHRMASGGWITVYESECAGDVKKLYDYIQELCSYSRDVQLKGNMIVSDNPFLVYWLQQLVQEQKMVPPGNNSPGVMMIYR